MADMINEEEILAPPTPYSIWENGEWVYDAGLAKPEKIRDINSHCRDAILSGFTSSALGTSHIYQSEEIDQVNLIGMVAANTGGYFKTGVIEGGETVWSYLPHTAAQLVQVLQDGKVTKLSLLQTANNLKARVHSATTKDELDKVSW